MVRCPRLSQQIQKVPPSETDWSNLKSTIYRNLYENTQETRHNVGQMLARCLRRRPNIGPTLGRCVLIAEYGQE